MIAIDTCVVLWGVRGVPDTQGRPMGDRCALLLDHCDQSQTPVLIPLPVLIESMVTLDDAKHADFVLLLKEDFEVRDLDEKAAMIAVRMERRRRATGIQSTGYTEPKQAIKVDVLIAAIAIANGATHLYTNNVSDFQKIATGEAIQVCELPELTS
jgi:predicted nucleic acid-binding protein